MKRKFPLEFIEWVDSIGTAGWQDVPSEKDVDDMTHHSAGFLVVETKKSVTLCCSISRYGDKHRQKVESTISIPKCSIVKRVSLGKVSKCKRK